LSREGLLSALAQRDAVIAVLSAEIEALKRRVGMDSSNSSMPVCHEREGGARM
jgi:transposase